MYLLLCELFLYFYVDLECRCYVHLGLIVSNSYISKRKNIFKFYFQSIVYLSPRPTLIGKTKHKIIGLLLCILSGFNRFSVSF